MSNGTHFHPCVPLQSWEWSKICKLGLCHVTLATVRIEIWNIECVKHDYSLFWYWVVKCRCCRHPQAKTLRTAVFLQFHFSSTSREQRLMVDFFVLKKKGFKPLSKWCCCDQLTEGCSVTSEIVKNSVKKCFGLELSNQLVETDSEVTSPKKKKKMWF